MERETEKKKIKTTTRTHRIGSIESVMEFIVEN